MSRPEVLIRPPGCTSSPRGEEWIPVGSRICDAVLRSALFVAAPSGAVCVRCALRPGVLMIRSQKRSKTTLFGPGASRGLWRLGLSRTSVPTLPSGPGRLGGRVARRSQDKTRRDPPCWCALHGRSSPMRRPWSRARRGDAGPGTCSVRPFRCGPGQLGTATSRAACGRLGSRRWLPSSSQLVARRVGGCSAGRLAPWARARARGAVAM